MPEQAVPNIRVYLYRAISLFLTVFVIYNAVRPSDPLIERSLFVGLLVLMVYMKPWLKADRPLWLQTIDVLCMVATVVVFGYIALYADAIEMLVLSVPTYLMVFGFVGVFLLLEATRRTMGLSLAILLAAFTVYIFFGQHLPAYLAGHVGFSTQRIMINFYLSTNGMFGIIAHTMLKYVILFYFFGQLLEWTGALKFIMNLALALVGRYRGGPAMVAVISSGMVGTVSGSAVANVMITGTVTIPLMKRTGFAPHVAGGIEAAASSGGQFMPPVMGAAAFLIAQFLGIPYFEVIKAAAIPAFLFYVAVLVGVYAYAVRAGLKPTPLDEIPSWRQVFAGTSGVTFLISFSVLVALLVLRYSAPYAVLASMAAGLAANIVVRLVRREPISAGSFAELAMKAPEGFVGMGAATAAVGIIVAVLMLTGLAGRFATVILALGGTNMLLILVMTMVAALIMGTGLPTSIIYILLALVLPGALAKLGILPLAAHLFIFYGGLMSMVTPPVALASYAGATVAGTDFWRTGVQGFLFSLSAYLLPFAFVYDNAYLMIGTPTQILFAAVNGAVAVSLLSISLVGAFRDKLAYLERAVLFVASIVLLMPGNTLIAAALAVVGVARPVLAFLRDRQAAKGTQAA